MHDDASGDSGVVMNVDVSAEERGIGHDHSAADLAIVGDMATRHDEGVAAESRDASLLFRAAIDRDAFANHVLISEDDLGVTAAIANVLRLAPNNRAGENTVVLADRDMSDDGHAIDQLSAAADANVRSDDAERADMDAVVQLGTRIDDRGWFYVDGHAKG